MERTAYPRFKRAVAGAGAARGVHAGGWGIAWAREQTRAPEHLLALVVLLKSCQVFDFIGEPLVAMTIAVLLAVVTFGYAVGFTGPDISSRIAKSVGPVAAMILIVGAGGGSNRR